MLSREQVLHVARLARLELSEDELDRMAAELSKVLDYMETIGELDLADVEPTSHPLDLVNQWAEDEPRPSLPPEEALANAPDPADGSFRVPAVR
jgi:aspartyl-tRNA(Asn)/glutamyl-tRNA(Gln) amidotransferase subunit C